MKRAALLLALVACGSRDAPDTKPSLSDALFGPASAMKLTRAEWTRVVVEPYRAVYDDYARAFDAAAPAIEARTRASTSKTIASRQHYAGDPGLTRGQARARWALPVQAPAQVVVLDEEMVDAVFVIAGGRYKAIVGVDQIVVDRTRALDESCAQYLEQLGTKECQIIGWAIADAALREDRAKLRHACSLATSQCAATKTRTD